MSNKPISYEIQWYKRVGYVSNLKLCAFLGCAYAIFVLLPLFYCLWKGVIPIDKADELLVSEWHVRVLVLWAILASIAYPAWAFVETSKFESWLLQEKQKQDRNPQIIESEERNYFTAMQSQAKSFWAGILAVYTIAGLWGAALKAVS